MSNKRDFELFLYKNKLNDVSLLQVSEKLSSKTIRMLMSDLETNTIYIYTDGGCINNGKKNAKGAYAVYLTDDKTSQLYKFNTAKKLEDEPTNQKAELLAVQTAFEIVVNHKEDFQGMNIVIVTDSMYTINCIEKWCDNWMKNNWKTSKNEAVKNADIIKQLIALKKMLPPHKFKHILSHTPEPKSNSDTLEYILWKGNHECDKLVQTKLKEC